MPWTLIRTGCPTRTVWLGDTEIEEIWTGGLCVNCVGIAPGRLIPTSPCKSVFPLPRSVNRFIFPLAEEEFEAACAGLGFTTAGDANPPANAVATIKKATKATSNAAIFVLLLCKFSPLRSTCRIFKRNMNKLFMQNKRERVWGWV